MARKYITTKNGSVEFKDAGGAFDSGESLVLGNTDFDAIYNPAPAFNFVLEVEAVYFLPLKSVRAFTKENEYEYIREGGVNDYIHLKRKPISKPFTFQIERYVGTESSLILWQMEQSLYFRLFCMYSDINQFRALHPDHRQDLPGSTPSQAVR